MFNQANCFPELLWFWRKRDDLSMCVHIYTRHDVVTEVLGCKSKWVSCDPAIQSFTMTWRTPLSTLDDYDWDHTIKITLPNMVSCSPGQLTFFSCVPEQPPCRRSWNTWNSHFPTVPQPSIAEPICKVENWKWLTPVNEKCLMQDQTLRKPLTLGKKRSFFISTFICKSYVKKYIY